MSSISTTVRIMYDPLLSSIIPADEYDKVIEVSKSGGTERHDHRPSLAKMFQDSLGVAEKGVSGKPVFYREFLELGSAQSLFREGLKLAG